MTDTLLRLTSHLAQTAGVNCLYGDTSCNTGLPTASANSGNLQNGLQIAFAIIGVMAVIMVVIGGLRFALSQGDPQTAAKARRTVMYAVIGLIIAISAEVIVTFVLNKL
jgi:hypothetical protein